MSDARGVLGFDSVTLNDIRTHLSAKKREKPKEATATFGVKPKAKREDHTVWAPMVFATIAFQNERRSKLALAKENVRVRKEATEVRLAAKRKDCPHCALKSIIMHPRGQPCRHDKCDDNCAKGRKARAARAAAGEPEVADADPEGTKCAFFASRG